MRIIHKRQHHNEVTYRLGFEYADSPGSGFSFDCDKDGKVTLASDAARKNYEACLSGRVSVIRGTQYDRDHNPIAGTGKVFLAEVFSKGVQTTEHNWSSPAVGECNHCGAEVGLHGFTNTCDCGTDYNMSGQELAPRECWGEETFENVADILSVDSAVDSDVLFDCND